MLKTLFVILTVLFGLAACQKPPENNPNARLAPVSFEQDFEFDPEKEQQFDFYISRWESKDKSFIFSVEFWLPEDADGLVNDTAWEYFMNLEKNWENPEDILYFEADLKHYLEDGRIIPVKLGREVSPATNPPKFELGVSTCRRKQDKNKKKYLACKYQMTGFPLENVEDGKKGFYRFKIRPLKKADFDYGIRPKILVDYPIYHK